MKRELLSKAFGDMDDCFVLEAYRPAIEHAASLMGITGSLNENHCRTGDEGDDSDGGNDRVMVAFDDVIL